MKKVILILVFALYSKNTFSQNNFNIISLEASSGVIDAFGLTWEENFIKNKEGKFLKTQEFKLRYGGNTLIFDNPGIANIPGKGFEGELGQRIYFNKNDYKGFYLYSSLLFGNIKYDENNIYDTSIYGGDGKFFGRYRYFSFFTPELGFKFLIAEKIAISLSLGTAWLIEYKGDGDIDNKWFDNWVVKGGLRIGYKF